MSTKIKDTNVADADETVNENVVDLKNKFLEVKDKLVESYEENTAKYKAKVLKANKDVVGYVKDNPWKTIGMVLVAGIAINKLFNLKK